MGRYLEQVTTSGRGYCGMFLEGVGVVQLFALSSPFVLKFTNFVSHVSFLAKQ